VIEIFYKPLFFDLVGYFYYFIRHARSHKNQNYAGVYKNP